jgi:hydrophobe/amphiphile efflux-1 (HAE1) family protein
VEADVTKKVEAAVNSVSGLDALTSTSTEGASLVVASFNLDIDPETAVQEVNEHLATVLRDLPGNARPEVRKVDPDAAPVLVLTVKGPAGLPIRELTRFADTRVKQRLERLAGVGQIAVLGGQDRQLDVRLDALRLAAAGVSALDVQRAIATSNVSVPGGRIEGGDTTTTLRIDSRVLDAEQLGQIVVRQRGELPIHLADVAEIADAERDPESSASRDGVPAIALSVRKQSGTNTVAVVDSLTAAVRELAASLPAGYRLEAVRDNSVQIRTSTDQVLDHLILGSLLAAFVVLLFLGNLRSTIIAAVSIPVSIIATFGLMKLAGFTLNLMTLLALALAVGIVIDDAIVVLENIDRFIHEQRMKPFRAAIAATREIGPAVLATTLSLLAVFLPVAFMNGIVGRIMLSFGLTMAFAIFISMIVAFTLTPLMASRMLAPPPAEGQALRRTWLERGSDLVYRPLARGYTALLAFCLRHRWVVGLAIIGSLASMGVVKSRVGSDFIPQNDDAQLEIYVQTPQGTTLEATTLVAERLARAARRLPEVESTLVTVGDSNQREPNVGRVHARLIAPERRASDQAHVMARLRADIARDVPAGTRVAVQPISDFSLGGQNAVVMYAISGPDLGELERYGKQVVAKMRTVPGVVDLDSSLVDPVAETAVEPDLDRAARLGVDPADITATLGVLIGGVEASTFEYDGDPYPVFVRAAEQFRDDPSALSAIHVPSRLHGQVPLSDVIRVRAGLATAKINRVSRERSVFITMNVAPGFSQSAIIGELERAIRDLNMPASYSAVPFGTSRELAKLKAAFALAIGLSIIFMYLVLAAQFESWLYPFIIMLSLPLVLPFALMSLAITGGSLNMFSMLGVIVLFAMVKKNAILQVDHTNVLRRAGTPRTEAVLAANRDRLRPILMTTFAFVAGMLPLVTSKGVGAGYSKAMASVVVGGQMLSLLLTLLAIPVLYTWFDDIAQAGRRLVRVLRRDRPVLDRGAAELGLVDLHRIHAGADAHSQPMTTPR